jgi:hypothetical protein
MCGHVVVCGGVKRRDGSGLWRELRSGRGVWKKFSMVFEFYRISLK